MVHCPPVTARFALFVAPPEPALSSASARLEALGWLRNQVVRRGFQVVIVGSGSSLLAELEPFAARLSPGDSVLVHVSGKLALDGSAALAATTPLPLSALTELLAARSPGYVSLILDLVHDEHPGSTDLLSEAVHSLGAQERGYSVLAAVRALPDASDRIAFTRLAMPPFDDAAPPSTEALLARMHERAVMAGQGGANGHRFVLLPGAPDTTIDGLITQAIQASDSRRVVELRLDRVEQLATVAQRVQELTGVARMLEVDLRDPSGAVDVLEHARTLDPKGATVREALRHAYEASGRAAPIDAAEHAKAFATHRRAGQKDAALLDAMLLEQLGVAQPEHLALVEESRSVGPMQVLKPLDAAAWDALRAPGFDEALATLFSAVQDTAVAARREQLRSNRRRPSLDPSARLDPESTVSAVRTLHWAARVLGVSCPALYAGTEDTGEAITHIPGDQPSISLAPHMLSGTSAKQLAFLAGRALTWYRPEYHLMLYYPALDDLSELARAAAERLGTGDGAIALEPWIRSAELTAARAGLFLCGELKTAVAGARSGSTSPGRPSAERVTSDLVAFCASRGHATLRAQFLRLTS
jgi:hypothetical protein